MKSRTRLQRYRLEQRVTQKFVQRNLIVISFTCLALFGITYIIFNLGSSVPSKAAVSYPQLTFSNQTLIKGAEGEVGALYKFSNVCNGIDAQIQVKGITGGAVIADMDYYSSGSGPAWQPSIQMAPNSTSFIDWEIKFKKAGTNIDTIISTFAITAIDEYSNDDNIVDFVSAENPNDYYRDPAIPLSLSYSGNMLEAIALNNSTNTREHNARKVMIQMNYSNVSCVLYRTGAVNSGQCTNSKLFSLFFKSYFSGNPISLPSEMSNFSGEKNTDNTITLKWETASEKTNSYFIIEKSIDGKNYKEIKKVNCKENSGDSNEYAIIDTEQANEKNYYTISQTDLIGGKVKLRTICVAGNAVNSPVTIESATISPAKDRLEVKYGCAANSLLKISLTDADGTELRSELAQASKGVNDFRFNDLRGLNNNLYFVRIDNYKLKYKTVKVIKL